MKNMKDIGYPEYCITKNGDVYSLKVNRFLKPALNGAVGSSRYRYVHIYDYQRNLTNVTVHRLVAKMYCTNDDPENKSQVNHIDGNKENNNFLNLEWVTPSQNNYHANDNRLRKPTYLTGSNVQPKDFEVIHDWSCYGKTDLSDDDVHKCCQMLQDGYRVCDVSSMTGYDRRLIQFIRDGKRLKWIHISSEYDFSKISRKQRTSPETVMSICDCLQRGLSISETSRDTGIERKTVANIKNRKFHTQISDNYVW